MKKSTKRRGGKRQTHPSLPEWGRYSGVNVSGGLVEVQTGQDFDKPGPCSGVSCFDLLGAFWCGGVYVVVSHEIEDI